MPSRILLLTHLLNGVSLSNCKSGKDRTGMLDAEVKFLAVRCKKYGAVPKVGAPLSDDDTELFQSLLLNSGSLEIQEYNTGLQGFKTSGVKSIEQRIGDKQLLREVTWGADAVAH